MFKPILIAALFALAAPADAQTFTDSNGAAFSTSDALMIEALPQYVHIIYADGRDAYYEDVGGKLLPVIVVLDRGFAKVGKRWVKQAGLRGVQACAAYCETCCTPPKLDRQKGAP